MKLEELLREVADCSICADSLPLGPRPVIQIGAGAKILIAGQAPGRQVHESGVPFKDPSGDRLRDWMGVDDREFYDPDLISILPMGFCFPGSSKSGDKPPRKECAPAWRETLLERVPDVQLTLVLGAYAQRYHLPDAASVTDAVARWSEWWPELLPLPHPSPRNRAWFKNNPWFDVEVLPMLRDRVKELLGPARPGGPIS
ncbi:MAG: uracil-DNA glycosylase family protein [Cyanobacteria bacterium J06627_8]